MLTNICSLTFAAQCICQLYGSCWAIQVSCYAMYFVSCQAQNDHVWNLISSSMNFLGFRRYCNAIKTLKPCLDYFCYNFLTFHWGIISQSSNLCLYFFRLPPFCSQNSFQLWLSFQCYFIIIKLISYLSAENFITTSFV